VSPNPNVEPGRRTLVECETVVGRGLDTFVEVGLALLEIRDRRLYHDAGFSNFAGYCRERWGWSRQHAYRLIDGAQVVELVSPAGDTLPSERVLRELAPLARADQEAAVALWAELRATHGDHVTAKLVRDLVGHHLGRSAPTPDFRPVSADSQPRLDRRRPITCPGCGHEFHLPR
jgi:hypothetical protein